MPVQQSPAFVVREARSRAGLSQRDMADQAHTAQSVVGRIEAGLSSPSFDTLARLLDVAGFDLGVTILAKPVRDPVVEAYKPGVDQTLLIENLRKTPRERFENLLSARRFILKVRRVGQESRQRVAEPTAPYGTPGDD